MGNRFQNMPKVYRLVYADRDFLYRIFYDFDKVLDCLCDEVRNNDEQYFLDKYGLTIIEAKFSIQKLLYYLDTKPKHL